MSSPYWSNPNDPGYRPRSLASRTIRQGQSAPPKENQYTSLGDFLQWHAARDAGAKGDPHRRLRDEFEHGRATLNGNRAGMSAFVGEHQLEKLREFAEAATKDLAATGPQVDTRFLNSLMEELRKLKILRGTYDEFKQLPANVERSLMERTLQDYLSSKSINMPETVQQNLIDVVSRHQKPWQMPVANYADDAGIAAQGAEAVAVDQA